MVAFAALFGALALSLSLPSAEATARGLAWATDNRFAPTIGSLPKISWYHHWQDGKVSQMPGKVEYVPMFWGPSKWDLWNSRVAEMKKSKPSHLLTFNEPDVPSQSNMDPHYAAELFMEQIMPWKWQGVKVGSPAVAWNLDWMDTFLKALWAKGGNVDFICIHWYGSWNDIAGFKKFVQTAHSRFGYKLWIPELGVTSGSNPSQAQTKQFLMQAYEWMDQQGYVDRASWFGCFEVYNPPDNYATGKNALFKAAYTLSDMGYYYGYSDHPDRRELHARHAAIAARIQARSELETSNEDDNSTHCDELCRMREDSLNAWHAANPNHVTPTVNVD